MFSHYFIDRPVLSTVLSVVIVIIGGVALVGLPIAQYPEIAPPTVSVSTTYPGASAVVVADTVATPIEQEINGVENMLYMTSRCTNDGTMSIDITFKLGTNLDMAQVLVQNRVAIASPRLPEEVRRIGITTKKRSPNILLGVNIISPDDSRDQLYLSNYAQLQIRDALARVEGVGDVSTLGARDYSMRIWLDPGRLAQRNMTVGDVTNALREQNVQVAAGRTGQPPVENPPDFQYPISTLGRLQTEEQFGDIVIKNDDSVGTIVYLRDVARIELGARNYDISSYLDGKPSALLGIFPLPGANALSTAGAVKETMERLKTAFPPGVTYVVVYDTTTFVEESISDVIHTLVEAFVLVFIVVLVFLQNWRATIMPMIEVPISLIGTFAVLLVLGFSLNNLSLFGLVLAIGIVVDDAIVVIENVERWMARGMNGRDATRKAMEEVTGPIIAITLVLSAVFIPTAFITGVSGQFYRQFALTIAASTIISALNALTMTPARCALILRPHDPHSHGPMEVLPGWGVGGIVGALAASFGNEPFRHLLGFEAAHHHGGGHGSGITSLLDPRWEEWWPWLIVFGVGFVIGYLLTHPVNVVLTWLLTRFNRLFDWATKIYGRILGGVIRVSAIMILLYVGLMGLTYVGFRTVPSGFIPEQDQGYLIVNVQLPDSSNLHRTTDVVLRLNEIALQEPGVAHTIGLPGNAILTSVNASNSAGMFITLLPFEQRSTPDLRAQAIMRRLQQKFAQIEDAQVMVFNSPPVRGIGNAGGFKLQVQDRNNQGPAALQASVESVIAAANAQPGLTSVFSSYSARQPQLYLDIDREKAKSMGVPLGQIFDALQGFLGAAYVNDLTLFGRNWQVNLQADAEFRRKPEDIANLKVRNNAGEMVPLGTLVAVRDIAGPTIVTHFNLYPCADVNGSLKPGTSSNQAIEIMEEIAKAELPAGFGFEWTDLSLQQILAGNTAGFVFVLGTVFVYLVLAAQYESWTMPTAVVLIVPMCLSAAIGGVYLMGMDNNIFTQIGLVVLIGLASKNAILIVEFARQLQDHEGRTRTRAAIEAAELRLRPILMTSLAFILGVVPLVRAAGAGAEMRQALGVAVFSGMLGVTIFGIFYTPVFYVVVRYFFDKPETGAGGSATTVKTTPSPSEPGGDHGTNGASTNGHTTDGSSLAGTKPQPQGTPAPVVATT